MGKLRNCKDYSIVNKVTTKDMYGRDSVSWQEVGTIKGYMYNANSYRDIQAYGDKAKYTYKIMSEQKAKEVYEKTKVTYTTSSATFSVDDFVKIDEALFVIVNIINQPKLLTLEVQRV